MFLLSPATRTDRAPHVRDPANVKRYMSMVMALLLPVIAASVWLFGWRILGMIAVTFAAGLAVEILFSAVRGEQINEGFFVTGLLYPLILPPNLPMWMVAVGIVFGVLVGKELFGGTGRNLFNPALLGRCFLALAYPDALVTGFWAHPGAGWAGNLDRWAADATTAATPLGSALTGEYTRLGPLLWGNVAGSAGETSALLIAAAGAVLLITGVINWRTVAATLVGFAGLGALTNAAGATSEPLVWHILAGGFLFGAVFMATDPVTSPLTNGGKWIYGLLIGAVTWLIRVRTGYVEGIMFAILLGNIAAPLLDELVLRSYLRKVRRER
jgi:Na(+)-translocating NADH:ubiquinone oxidoreductase B subunit